MHDRSRLLALLLTTTTLPLACGDDGAPAEDPSDAELYACKETKFGGAPLAGPGFDAMKGGIQGPLQPSYVLHATQIYIRGANAQEFYALADQIGEQARNTEGLIAYSVGADQGCGVARTIGIWANEEAMYKLVTSDVHAKAMAMTGELSYTARVTHWTATAEEANAYTYDVSRAKLDGIAESELY